MSPFSEWIIIAYTHETIAKGKTKIYQIAPSHHKIKIYTTWNCMVILQCLFSAPGSFKCEIKEKKISTKQNLCLYLLFVSQVRGQGWDSPILKLCCFLYCRLELFKWKIIFEEKHVSRGWWFSAQEYKENHPPDHK